MSAKQPTRARPAPLPPTEDEWPDSLLLLNCARCGRVMRSPKNVVAGYDHLPLLFARVYGRPVCVTCYPRAVREPAPPECTFAIRQTWE